jgi:hypothetical protein
MAGTLTISTLSDGTNSTSATNCIQGSAKAWVNFDGQTGNTTTVRASYNVSSVTYNAAGNYSINFTNAFADANYACCMSGDQIGNNDTRGTLVERSYDGNSFRSTTSLNVVYGYTFTTGLNNDGAWSCSVSVFR